MLNEELYRSLYSKYAPELTGVELDEKLKYASTLDINDFINSFYQKYTGQNPTKEQSDYINTFIDESEKTSAVLPSTTEFNVENISSELPQITYKDVDLAERGAINAMKQKLGGLGFTFDQTGWMGIDWIPSDYITITSPEDANGNTVTKRFSVDQWLGKRQSEANEINAWVKEHVNSVDINEETYNTVWNYANTKKITFKNKEGKVEEVKQGDATSEQLSEHMKGMYYEIMASSEKLPGVDRIYEELNSSLETYAAELVVKLQKVKSIILIFLLVLIRILWMLLKKMNICI